MLTSTPLWALVCASMQQEFQQKLPQELQIVVDELKSRGSSLSDELSTAIELIAPYVGNWVASLATGRLSDVLIEQEILTRTQQISLHDVESTFATCTCKLKSFCFVIFLIKDIIN